MNPIFILRVGFAFLVVTNGLKAVRAQSYSIDWPSIDGGGGTSTGGAYSVSGTIGQTDAGGSMTGGIYSLTGGFWSLMSAVQTPTEPLLWITLTPTNTVLLSWPSVSVGFVLQQNSNLRTTNWTDVGVATSDNGTMKSVVMPLGTKSSFYRLRK